MNILIKLTCLIGLVIVYNIRKWFPTISAACCATTEMCTSMSKKNVWRKDVITCKFMGAGTSETVTNSKEVSIEKQM
jgi:hypothetical protein